MKKKVLKLLFCIIVLVFIIHIALSLLAADNLLKQIEIAQLIYISNMDISRSRNLCFEGSIHRLSEENNNELDYEKQEIDYILDDVTKNITYYPSKKTKVTQISYLGKEINYLETEDGSVKIMYEETYPEAKIESYEVPNKNDEELGKLSSVSEFIFSSILNNSNIDTITNFKITEGVEDGIKCYIAKYKSDNGYRINYIDGSGFCFKTVETKIDLQSGKEEIVFIETRKATFFSVNPEDIAELDKNEFTIVDSVTYQEKFLNLLYGYTN